MVGFLFKLFNFLDRISGWEVELVGGLLYLASVALFFRDKTGLVLIALFALWLISSLTRAFHFLAKFADEHNWVAFVALCVAVLGVFGHPHGRWIASSVFTIFDGRYFEQNY